MAYTLPTNDFMFPHMITDEHQMGGMRIYNRTDGEFFIGVVVAMREGEYVVELKEGRYSLHEGDFSIAHVK